MIKVIAKMHQLSAALSAILITGGCSEPVIELEKSQPNVSVVVPISEPVSDGIYFPAVAKAAEHAKLSFRLSGKITQINVQEGEQVKAGDVIAEIDPTDYELEVDNIEAKYSVLNSQYQRSMPLVKRGMLAKSQFDEIAANREIVLAQLELARLHLSYTKLIAPIDGVISRVNAETHESVQVGQQVFNIHSPKSVEIVIQLPDMLYVKQPTGESLENISATVRVQNGNQYDATLKEFTTEPDPKTGTFNVTLTMPMPASEYILDGMAVEVTSKETDVGLDFDSGVSVPIEAIFNADGDALTSENKFVWVVDETQIATKRRVVVGKIGMDSVQVLEGLAVDEKVVVAGKGKLVEGVHVNIISGGAGQ